MLQKALNHFATKNTMQFFQKLNLTTDFLELPIEHRHNNLKSLIISLMCYSNCNFQNGMSDKNTFFVILVNDLLSTMQEKYKGSGYFTVDGNLPLESILP